MRRIIILQRWFRTCLIRLHFLQKRDATLIIQVQFISEQQQILKGAAEISSGKPVQFLLDELDLVTFIISPTRVYEADQQFLFLQRSWREFFENQNRAATVIQTAWRTSLKRPNDQQEDGGGDKKTSSNRPGRDRYTYHSTVEGPAAAATH